MFYFWRINSGHCKGDNLFKELKSYRLAKKAKQTKEEGFEIASKVFGRRAQAIQRWPAGKPLGATTCRLFGVSGTSEGN